MLEKLNMVVKSALVWLQIGSNEGVLWQE